MPLVFNKIRENRVLKNNFHVGGISGFLLGFETDCECKDPRESGLYTGHCVKDRMLASDICSGVGWDFEAHAKHRGDQLL